MKSTQVNLMLVVALILSIICFFLMDLFVAEADREPSTPCLAVCEIFNMVSSCELFCVDRLFTIWI